MRSCPGLNSGHTQLFHHDGAQTGGDLPLQLRAVATCRRDADQRPSERAGGESWRKSEGFGGAGS